LRRTLTLLLAIVAVSACSDKQRERFNDAPRGETNADPADIFTMPDGFSNGSTKCDHGNRIYVVFHGDSNYGAIAVVPQDPTCPQPER
jgi:hypothetical protein